MLSHPIFFFETRKNMVRVFGTLFNEISIQRTTNNTVQQVLRVPLTYAPKNKLLLRADKDPDATKEDAIVLPRMAFEMMPPMQYDGSRRQAPLEKFVTKHLTDSNKLKRQYIPVPYNLNFNLYIYVNHLDDGDKILEQIVPFFTPDWTVSVNIIPEMNLTFDVPIILSGISFDDRYDGQFKDRRVMIWTLSFVMKTYFLGPIKNKPIIKFAKERFFVGNTINMSENNTSNTSGEGMIIVQPGLDANGNPTSDVIISIDPNTIFVDDDFGYVESFSEGTIIFQDSE